MWRRTSKTWSLFPHEIVATQAKDATCLYHFVRHVKANRMIAAWVEVVDLQRYRLVSHVPKVRNYLREKQDEPFIFFHFKN